MGMRSWPEERAEIAIWLSGFLGTYKKWVDKILDNDDHDVTKNKIIDLLTDWIQKLEEEKTKIMRMTDTAPEVDVEQGYDQFVEEQDE